ncbi:MAG: TonB-dependent receptor [Acidobacteria bacterium]|nr:TonB-dependent receptor [Acidobacteriota bacterium]
MFSVTALAQTATGSISGVAQDESGAVIPGASVTVINEGTGITNSLVTDASGRYRVPSLIPGHYRVQAQITGFETSIRTGLQLTVGSELVINMVLKVGQVTQQTVVTAEAPMVSTTSSTLASLVDDKAIRDLPLNGRGFGQLISLESAAPAFRARNVNSPLGVTDVYSVNGARAWSNMILLDGTEVVGTGYENSMPGGVLGRIMGVDAIQEFTVLSSNYTAAYGKREGGIVNVATRSGTNQIHGSAFEFLRNSALDARNFFDPGSSPAPFKRNSFGAAVGGPVRKDHSFFFGNYEGLRDRLGLTNIATVPDANVRATAVPAIQPYLAALYPLPNGRNFGDGTGELISSVSQPSNQDFILVRFDQKISDKDSFFGRYNLTRSNRTSPETVPIFSGPNSSGEHVLTLEERRAYTHTVNLIRFGYSRGRVDIDSVPYASLDPSLRFLPGAKTVGQINFTGSGGAITGGSLTRTGVGTSIDRAYALNQFEVADQVYHYRGAHSLQFGAQLQRIQQNERGTSSATYGTFQFSGLANLLAGRPTQFTGVAPGANDPTKAYRQIYFASFVQDDYKVLPNLTLNLGLRYELMTVPVDATGRLSNYLFKFQDGLRVVDSAPTLGSPMFAANHKNFAPRLGFAWDPFSDGKLALRGGFGIFYGQITSDFRHTIPSNLPYVSVLSVANPPFPLGFSGGGGTAPLPRPEIIDFNFHSPTRIGWSFSIQRQITSSNVLEAAYAGSHSYHLSTKLEGNTAVPQILPGGVYSYPAGTPRINPALSSVLLNTSDANASYHSLQLNYIQRLSRGLRYKVSYTYSKNMDHASAVASAASTGVSNGRLNPYNRSPEWGLAAFDIRSNLVMNVTYDLPTGNLSGFSGTLLGGWQVSGIATLSAGYPFTGLTSFNRSRDQATSYTSDRPNLKTGASNNPVLGGPDKYFDPSGFDLQPAGVYGNLGRTTLVGPGFVNLDFSLCKVTSVSESAKVEFRAEFFNLLNHANFDLPNNNIFSTSGQILGSAGRIRGTSSPSRQIQFGMKLLF